MNLEFLTEKQVLALEALAVYRYLTPQQMVNCGVSSSLPYLRNKVLKRLSKEHRPLIKYKDFGFIATQGQSRRVARLYYLTKQGAEVVAEHKGVSLDKIIYPVGGIQFSNDYFHRIDFIDVHIALRKWVEKIGCQIQSFDGYFDTFGSNRRSKDAPLTKKNKILLNHKIFIPDGVCKISSNKDRLFLIEIHRGNNTKRILEQIDKHIDCISRGIFSKKYKHLNSDSQPLPNFLLSVYEKESIMNQVKKRLLGLSDFQNFLPLILFATVDEVKKDFEGVWMTANNHKMPIFEKIKEEERLLELELEELLKEDYSPSQPDIDPITDRHFPYKT